MTEEQNILISIVGPTAIGKTKVGIDIAKHFGTDIISVDSRQFYKEMELGTAKPTLIERSQAAHHFIDSHSIHEKYNVGDFERDALDKLNDLFGNNRVVVAVGGSGLFFKAIWEGFDEMPNIKKGLREELNFEYKSNGLENLLKELELLDPAYYNSVDHKNWQRVIRALEVIRSSGKTYSSFRINNQSQNRNFVNIKVGLEEDRGGLFKRINHRMDQMIEAGLFEEAIRLYPYRNLNALNTVGYAEIFRFIDGEYDKEEAIRLLKRNSRRYAKRQFTWFRKYQDIHWYHRNESEQIIKFIEGKIN